MTGSDPNERASGGGRRSVWYRLLSYGLYLVDSWSRRASLSLVAAIVRISGAPGNAVHTFTTRAELTALARLAMKLPNGVASLEIGSYVGASARYLAAGRLGRGGRVYCVDTWNNETMPDGIRDTFSEFQKNLGKLSPLVTPIRKRSTDLTPTDVPEPVGLVFIDGDHSYEGVRADFDVIQRLLSPDAVVAFHDCSENWPGVRRVIGEALATGDWLVCGQVGSFVWIRRFTEGDDKQSASSESRHVQK